jgi:hypothetical protein
MFFRYHPLNKEIFLQGINSVGRSLKIPVRTPVARVLKKEGGKRMI